MELLIIRHAIAVEREEFNGEDEDRPLTSEGRDKMARTAAGLRAIVPRVDFLVTSPLLRARQTAEIVAREYEIEIDGTTDRLVPDASLDDFAKWLEGQRAHDVVAVVGHEPHLSTLATWLIGGGDESHLTLKKGGCCLLTIDGKAGAGSATLEWLLTPKQLGRLS